jgi:hypothetical protein
MGDMVDLRSGGGSCHVYVVVRTIGDLAVRTTPISYIQWDSFLASAPTPSPPRAP